MTLKPDTLNAITLDEAAQEACGVLIECHGCGRCKTIPAAAVIEQRPSWHFKRGDALKFSCQSCGATAENVMSRFVNLQADPTPQRAYG